MHRRFRRSSSTTWTPPPAPPRARSSVAVDPRRASLRRSRRRRPVRAPHAPPTATRPLGSQAAALCRASPAESPSRAAGLFDLASHALGDGEDGLGSGRLLVGDNDGQAASPPSITLGY